MITIRQDYQTTIANSRSAYSSFSPTKLPSRLMTASRSLSLRGVFRSLNILDPGLGPYHAATTSEDHHSRSSLSTSAASGSILGPAGPLRIRLVCLRNESLFFGLGELGKYPPRLELLRCLLCLKEGLGML